ncbi:HTH-type transcriptional repressor CarH [Thermoflexales bacterium]|nr:HTH-type transcriptional repressor CarH [Thermoflexales bacterium]
MPSEAPTFNLKAVVRDTGLKPDTIRAWERRYGVPQPRRTAGGHRLYSQRDIDLLKWMNARQHEGLSISRIVALWKSLEAEGKDPLQVTAHDALQQTMPLGDMGELANLRREWVQACLNFDEPRAERMATQAFALFPLDSVVLDVLLRGLAEIGEAWYRGEVAVQQEHFASSLAVRRLQTLIAASPAPTRAGRLVVACPPEEQHTVSLHVINLFLRRQGWDVIDLGANVPLARLETMLLTLRPQLVIAAAQHLPTAQTLQAMALTITSLKIPLGFGGSVFNRHPTLQQHIAGHFLGEDLSELTGTVQGILRQPWPLPDFVETTPDYLMALEHYHECLSLIDTTVLGALKPELRELVWRADAQTYLAQYIRAALALGDINFLDVDLSWIRGLLSAHQLPAEALYGFLQVYRTALQKHLDQRGAIIVEWFQRALPVPAAPAS